MTDTYNNRRLSLLKGSRARRDGGAYMHWHFGRLKISPSIDACVLSMAHNGIPSLNTGQHPCHTVELVWRSQWSSSNTHYFLARYHAIVYFVSEVLFLNTADPSTYIFILDIILLFRVYALYNRNKFLFIFLSLCTVGSTAAALWAFSVVCRHGATAMAAPWRACRSMASNMMYGIAA
ncbi:uncharacterized protein BT62DRAFT_203924 [Guyanagaster necrorhizus]|uniref:Uncharacterized protein n=1 Tax=Guyanagaster necrorhizus TaxID=856835 RepID=A0A9P8AR35_9AGAR|nr:uncharacterized protein BT62DRAFT_203924 [Guyanagaster necrorhizus MCA 3950]KAG7444993.1 hypothetical protein BT62DRAFT_203924 [Guyanagaster necrorhizus MCA 3950]